MDMARILIVEDEAIIAADLASRLRKMGHDVVAIAASGARALSKAAEHRPDLVLMDIVLQGDMNGIETAGQMRQVLDAPVIFLTSYSDAATVKAAVGTSPFAYLLKPFHERELDAAIQVALYRHRTETKLRKLERWLSATVSSLGDAIITTDLHGCVTLINPAAQTITGWTESDALGKPFHEIFRVFKQSTREPAHGLLQSGLEYGIGVGFNEHVVVHARNEGEMPVDHNVAPIRDESGASIGVVLVFRSCSERLLAEQTRLTQQLQLEHNMLRRVSELERANRDLSAFTAAVAHDLRAPLRAVTGFSAMLTDRYGSALDPDGRQFIDIIHRKSGEMQDMIDAFMRLYRMRQEPLQMAQLDVYAIVRKLIDEMQVEQPRAARVVVDALPAVEGDEALMRMLWVNLVTNALKFTAGTEPAQIRISGEAVGSEAVFRISDNGMGFDMAQASRLFTIFQRLHTQTEFAGNGIGLAIVSAVVERHRGSVSGFGRPGAGARFEVRWPLVQVRST